MVDALRIARDEVKYRMEHHINYDLGKENSIKSLGSEISKYAKKHHLSAQQVKDFHQSSNFAYIGLASLATYSKSEFNKLDRAVINNNHLSDYNKLKISAGRMIEGYTGLWSFMGYATAAAMFTATLELTPGVGKGPVGTRINSETQQMIVSRGLSKRLNSFQDIVNNPKTIWGKSAEEVQSILGEGWTMGKYGKTGTGWKFTKDDKSVFFHQGGRHEGDYYGFSSGTTGKVKVVDPNTYKPIEGDKAQIINR